MKKVLLLLILAGAAIFAKAQSSLPYVDLSFELANPPANGSNYVIEFGDSLSIPYKITNHGVNDLDTIDFIFYGGEVVPPGWALVLYDSITDEKKYLEPGDFFIARGIQFNNSDSTQLADTTIEFCFYFYHDWNAPFYQDTVAQNDTLCFSIHFKGNPGTSIANNRMENGVKIYPNPTNDFLKIEFPKPLSKAHSIKVLNVLGQEVYNSTIAMSANDFTFDAQSLAKGNYVLIIEGEMIQLSKKWVKQ